MIHSLKHLISTMKPLIPPFNTCFLNHLYFVPDTGLSSQARGVQLLHCLSVILGFINSTRLYFYPFSGWSCFFSLYLLQETCLKLKYQTVLGENSIIFPLLTRGPTGCDASTVHRGMPHIHCSYPWCRHPLISEGNRKKPTFHQPLNPEQKPCSMIA